MPTIRVTPPPDVVREWRHQNGALYERPSRPEDPAGHVRYQYQGRIGPVFVPDSVRSWKRGDPVTWENLNTEWQDAGTDYREGNAYYRIRVPKDSIGYRYESRTEGFPFVEVTLTHVGGAPVGAIPVPSLEGNTLWWRGVRPGLDIYLLLTTDKAELKKRILTSAAPRSMTWEVRHTDPLPIRRQAITTGQDNYDLTDATRQGLGPGRRRRWIEMTHDETPLPASAGERRFTFEEEWTGRTFAIPDPITRIKVPVREASYPIEIDVLVEEEIAADGDDGDETSGSAWENTYGGGNHIIWDSGTGYRPGYRFTTVAIPNGATIDDATFAVERSSTDNTVSAPLAGSDIDDMSAWSTSNGPREQTATTATVASFNWAGTAGTDISLDVQAIIAEITSRAGWASGNAIGLFCSGAPTDGGYQYLEDEADAAAGAARLDVNYTAAGGPTAPANYPWTSMMGYGA